MVKSRTLLLLIVLLFSTCFWGCRRDSKNVDSSTETQNLEGRFPIKGNSQKEETCEIESIIKRNTFLYANQDTVSLINREQLLYRIDSQVIDLLQLSPSMNYYYVSSYILSDDLTMFTYFEDETEAPAIYLATLYQCELVSTLALASGSTWENGNTKTISVVHDNMTLEKITFSASKDWGDYTEWIHDTTFTQYMINAEGTIEELRK